MIASKLPVNVQQKNLPRSSEGGYIVECSDCHLPYVVKRIERRAPRHRCLSCRSRGNLAQVNQQFRCNQATPQQKAAANGLVNMRIRRGNLKRPALCAACGGQRSSGASLIAHHFDYEIPEVVLFVCDSCHWHCHHTDGFEDRHADKQVLVGVLEIVPLVRKTLN